MDADFWNEMKPKFLKPDEIHQEQPQENLHFDDDPFPNVPDELKALEQWVLWKAEIRDGKPTKVPYQSDGNKAQTNALRTWTDYRSVCQHLSRFTGIGCVFTEDDSLCGIDLDNCLDANGKVKAWAVPIVEALKQVSYGEVSPNQNGIKFWTRAELPPIAKHKVYIDQNTGEAIEAYDKGRYFTVTGKGKGEIKDGQAVIDRLVSEHLKPEPSRGRPQPTPAKIENRTASEVIEKIRASKQLHKFEALMRGDTRGYGSASEADIGLCSVLAFWTQDISVIDTIFRQSQLYRPKWDDQHRADGATYGEMTIETALSGSRETYNAPQRNLSTQRETYTPRGRPKKRETYTPRGRRKKCQ